MNAPPNDDSGRQSPQSVPPASQPQRDIYGNLTGPAQPIEQSTGQAKQPSTDITGNVYDQAYVQSPERPAEQSAQPSGPFSPPSSSDPQTPLPPTSSYTPGAGLHGQEASTQPYGQQASPYGQQAQYGQQVAGVPYATQYAGVGIRAVALILDSVLIGILTSVIAAVFSNGSISSVFAAVIMFAYYIIMEANWGATLGKMAFKLRVVRTDGAPISWQEAAIRNLLRIVDGLFFYLVGAILVWLSPMRQRLGDRLAHTVVVQSRI